MASYNFNQPVQGNPFLDIPSDMDNNPFRLAWEDVCSVFRLFRLVPLMLLPLRPCRSGPLDELYLNLRNSRDLFLHIILIIGQLALVASFPIALTIFWAFPVVAHVAFYLSFYLLTRVVLRLLNGPSTMRSLIGVPKRAPPVNDESELWFFINGIATGKHWLESNLELLADTFGREIVGIHNPTNGFILDLVECIIQRDLDYKTHDIRQGRAQIRAALKSITTKKVVIIAHSQGGLEAASIIDWLFGELSNETMRKLEVYTFANAARHFRNPLMKQVNEEEPGLVHPRRQGHGERVIRYIEHYANTEDFVANIGVLQFTSPIASYSNDSMFSGSVFIRKGTGHLLNMHYLDTMFGEKGEFMDSTIAVPRDKEGVDYKKVKEVSRLYRYMNGKSPE